MSSIADQKSPRERLVQVVRWYMSAFHAGRKSGVAKKPYNPIFGETFQCFYELPTEFSQESNQVDHQFFNARDFTEDSVVHSQFIVWRTLNK